jgi:hypothetical protein
MLQGTMSNQGSQALFMPGPQHYFGEESQSQVTGTATTSQANLHSIDNTGNNNDSSNSVLQRQHRMQNEEHLLYRQQQEQQYMQQMQASQ